MSNEDRHRIARLADLDDYEVADHEPDVRGWKVMSADGMQIGIVDDLYVDPAAKKVRYLNVELDGAFHGSGVDRHMMVPISAVQLQESGDNVIIHGLRSTAVTAVPRYSGRADATYEDSVRTYWASGA